MQFFDHGYFRKVKELITDNDILVTFIVQTYNRNVIRLRKEGAYNLVYCEGLKQYGNLFSQQLNQIFKGFTVFAIL